MLNHTSSPSPTAIVSPLGVIDVDNVLLLLGVSRGWLEKTIRKDPTFPRLFKIGGRRHVRFADLQAWVDRKAEAA